MPHVIVKLWPGKSEQQKTRLAEEIVKDVMSVLNYGEESVSVAIEEVPAQEWAEKVYEPDIEHRERTVLRYGCSRATIGKRFSISLLGCRKRVAKSVQRGEPFANLDCTNAGADQDRNGYSAMAVSL